MSLIKNLIELGVKLHDAEELVSVVQKYGIEMSLSAVVSLTLDNNRKVYHHYRFSRTFKMFLRVVCGFLVYGEIDQKHRDAIFFEFENPLWRKTADPAELEEFFQILSKFWKHKLSKPIRCKINRLLEASRPSQTLFDNLKEFEYPLTVTRSKAHLLSFNDISKGPSQVNCLRKEQEERRFQRQVDKVMSKADKYLANNYIDIENFRMGFFDGDCDGHQDGVRQAVEDSELNIFIAEPRKTIYMDAKLPCWYTDGYLSGYNDSFFFHYKRNHVRRLSCTRTLF